MGVTIQCNCCKRYLVISDSTLGKTVKCPACEVHIEVAECVQLLPPLPNPDVACVLSAISPGLGYVYCGYVFIGLIFSSIHAAFVVAVFISPQTFGLIFFAVLMQLLFAYSARDIAIRRYFPDLSRKDSVAATAKDNPNAKTLMAMLGRTCKSAMKSLFGSPNKTKD